MPAEMLVDYVYGDRPKGPPKHPVQVINITLQRLRGCGYPVGSVRGRRGFAWDEDGTFRNRGRRKRGRAVGPQR